MTRAEARVSGYGKGEMADGGGGGGGRSYLRCQIKPEHVCVGKDRSSVLMPVPVFMPRPIRLPQRLGPLMPPVPGTGIHPGLVNHSDLTAG